jgi:uncharacterized membrane protein
MSDVESEGAEDATPDGGDGGGLAKKILVPAATGAGALAATVAARKAPQLIRDHLMPQVEEKGSDEAAKVGKDALQKMTGGGGGGIAGKLAGKALGKAGGGGREKTRRLPIQRWTDVAAPVDVTYAKWTEFDEFPKFMHRVLSVERKDDEHVSWREKIWFSTREWEGEITERRKNDRIAWKTTKGTSHSGVVTFHALDDNLTRVMVTLDFHPTGMIEKMASGLRFVKRAVQADLARFKAYVELGEAEGVEYTQAATTDGSGSDRNGDRSQRDRSPEQTEQARSERAQRRAQRRT